MGSSSQARRPVETPAPRRPASGLRERKKARTRAAIQREALKLFREQGYGATTVEQIAEAAEVAPSTVFRYFPTKEDLVTIESDLEPLIAAFHAQPPEMTPLQAIHRAFMITFGKLAPTELEERREREEREMLILSIPELWTSNLSNITHGLHEIAVAVGQRVGRAPDDARVRSFVGAVCGAVLSVWLAWALDPTVDLAKSLDDALSHLESGLPL